MLSQLLVEPGRFELREIPEPKPGKTDVLLKVAAVAICGSDLSAYRGTHPAIRPPTVLGHEFSAEVVSVGAEVEGLFVGDRVCVDPTFGCGQCRHCMRGRGNICAEYSVMGRSMDTPGGLAGHVAVPAERVYKLPLHVSLEAGALVQPLAVAYHASIHQGRVGAGDIVLIAGVGAIGLGALLSVKAAGARAIVADIVDSRLDLATSLGADAAINTRDQPLDPVVQAETGGYGADVVLEAVGGPNDALFRDLFAFTSSGGRIVLIGLKTPSARIPARRVKYEEITVVGSQAHPDSFPAVLDHMAAGRFPAERLISHRLSFSEIAKAMSMLDEDPEETIKVVLRP